MLVICLTFVGLIVVVMCLMVLLKMAFDARLLYAIKIAVMIVKREKSNFIERWDNLIDAKTGAKKWLEDSETRCDWKRGTYSFLWELRRL